MKSDYAKKIYERCLAKTGNQKKAYAMVGAILTQQNKARAEKKAEQ